MSTAQTTEGAVSVSSTPAGASTKRLPRRLLWIGLAVVVLALVPLLAGNFTVSLLNDIGIGALVALGWCC